MRAWSVVLAALLACPACGDELAREPTFAATSGTQLAVDWFRFDDGTELPDATEHYDMLLHTACRATTWIDGTTRCVPIADEAVYTDAACTTAAGHAQAIEKPTHFIAYEYREGDVLPAHVFEATKEAAEVSQYYLRIGDECTGPYGTSGGSYVALGAEVAGARLAELHDHELGEGRLGLVVRTSADGLRVLMGTTDRTLGAACTPERAPDGTTWCAPATAVTARFFADPACLEPAVGVSLADDVPEVARVLDDAGCATYRRVGAELPQPVYRREGDVCTRVDVESVRAFALAGPFDPIPLRRDDDTADGRRLARIVLAGDGEPFLADTLLDTATRTDCQRVMVGDAIRCLPTVLANGFTLFAAGCGVAVPVAQLPARACTRPRFATAAATDGAIEVRAIGDAPAAPLYLPQGGACIRYTPPADTELHTLGPALPAETFEAAIHFGAR